MTIFCPKLKKGKGISVAHIKWIFLFLFLSSVVHAVEIAFPQEELPNESFPPQLDSPQVVIARKVSFTRRWEPQISYGWLLDEPFYQGGFVTLGMTYSWSEFSGVTLKALSWSKGLSDYSNQFAKTNSSLQFGRSHGPETGYSLSYNDRLLYGKVSFSKDLILPTTLAANYEVGMIKYGDQSLPFAGAGINNAWYFSKKWSLNIGLNLYLRQALDPLSADLKAASPIPAESSFGTTTRLSTSIDFGLHYLF